ncbi:hypothetical protein ACIP5Y_33120 [Nocardia sp. NPDC088792]|uniref:hypothetical protein n=1 Tax=Nocardia sp. NPDC088792 TaxID=3364332 RepID=UPI00380B0762
MSGMIVVAGRTVMEVTDDFNRADGGLGANYVTIAATPRILGGKVQGGVPTMNTAAFYDARHTTAFTGDSQEVSFALANPAGIFGNSLGAGVFLRSTVTGDRVIGVVTGSTALIGTVTGNNPADRASAPIPTPTTARFTAIGNTYSLYVNGSSTPTVTWTDTAGAAGIGDDNRNWGVYVTAQTTFAGTSYGYAIDAVTARDL